MRVSVIVPVFNEIGRLPGLCRQLKRFEFDEVIFVDGGSDDGSWQWLEQNSQFKSVQSQPGRARQMNEGAALAKGNVLLFLHADSNLPGNAKQELSKAFEKGYQWGRFNIQFSEQDWRMKIIAFFINLRSRLSAVATGDQGIFIDAGLFNQIGKYADIPLMEDVALCKKLKKHSKPYCSQANIETSARRWLTNGVIKTVIQMWWFRFAYFVGISPSVLVTQYRNVR